MRLRIGGVPAGRDRTLGRNRAPRPRHRCREDDRRHPGRGRGGAAGCRLRDGTVRSSATGFAGLFAEVAEHYEKRYGPVGHAGHDRRQEPPQRRRQPLRAPAQGPRRGVLPDVSDKNPVVAGPLRRTDCSPVSDGAAAIVLSTQPVPPGAATDPVRLLGFGQANDFMPTDRRDPLDFRASELAWHRALAMAGVQLAHLSFAGTPRLLHDRRADPVRGPRYHRARAGSPGGRRGLGPPRRQDSRQRLRRSEVQGASGRRDRRLPARDGGHAVDRHRRCAAASRRPLSPPSTTWAAWRSPTTSACSARPDVVQPCSAARNSLDDPVDLGRADHQRRSETEGVPWVSLTRSPRSTSRWLTVLPPADGRVDVDSGPEPEPTDSGHAGADQ